jgi:hypothetical protein
MSALIDPSLPVGIRSRHVQIATGLNMHILEAGEPDGRPLILLLSGTRLLLARGDDAFGRRRVLRRGA